MESAGNRDDECIGILKNIVSNCETCIRYSRPKPKPAVGLSMASTYNETVAVDLHELEPGLWYHCISLTTLHASVRGVLSRPRSLKKL